MGCGTSTAAPAAVAIGTQTDRSFIARQKDREAIETSSSAAKLPRRQLRPLGRGPDLNAIEADARNSLRPTNVLPAIRQREVRDGATQNQVLPLYHPPLVPQASHAGGPSQETTETGSQSRSVLANGTETVIVIPDETFDSSEDDLSSVDDDNQDVTPSNSYVNGLEKVGIASIVGANAEDQLAARLKVLAEKEDGAEVGNEATESMRVGSEQATGSNENHGKKTANVSPTKIYSLGATDTLVNGDQLVRNSTANRNATEPNTSVGGATDVGIAATDRELDTTSTDVTEQTSIQPNNDVVGDNDSTAANHSPEETVHVEEYNNNAQPKRPVEVLLQKENGETLKKIHVEDNFSVEVNIVLQAVDPTNVVENGRDEASENSQAGQNGSMSETNATVTDCIASDVNNDQHEASANVTSDKTVTVEEKNLSESTNGQGGVETRASDIVKNIPTEEKFDADETNATELRNLPEVVVSNDENEEQNQTSVATEGNLNVNENTTMDSHSLPEVAVTQDEREEQNQISVSTEQNANVDESTTIDSHSLLMNKHESEEQNQTRVTNGITDQTLESGETAETTGKQRRLFKLLTDFNLKEKLEERNSKRDVENTETKKLESNGDEDKKVQNQSNGTPEEELSENEKEQNLSNETIEGDKPEPTVQQRKKAEVLAEEDITLFKYIEVHAVYHALEPPKAADTFAALMNTLLIPDLSDLEKVRMLFHWVTAQNLQEMTFGDDVEEDSPLGYLKAIKEGRSTCAKLFKQLCSAASLTCHVVKGYKKGDDCLPDHNFFDHRKKHRGTWNAVLVAGEWRLIDCHWAARGMAAIEENGADIQNISDVYSYEEFFFLTDPEDFIDTHFPDCPEWQMLEKYLTLGQFQSRVRRWPMFHHLGLQLKSHRAVVSSTAGELVELTVGFSKEKRKDFRLVCHLKTKEGESDIEGTSLNRYVVQETWDSNENFTLDVPKPGKYILDIYGHPLAEARTNDAGKVCQYMIACDFSEAQAEKILPFSEHHTTWGPAKDLSGSGVFPITHARAVVRSQGQVVLTFRTDRHLEFRHKLFTQKSDETGLENFVVHSVTKHSVSFYVRTPAKGKYGLILYTKDSQGDIFKEVYSYVIVCEREQQDITTFPVVQNGRFGITEPHFSNFGLIEEQNATYFLTSDNGEVEVQLENPDQKQLMLSLSQSTETGTERFDQYILMQSLADKSILLIHLPQVGEYALQVFAMNPDTQEEPLNVVNYYIRCSMAKEDCKPFPRHNEHSWGPTYPTFSDLGLALDVPQRPCLITRSGKYSVSLAMTKPLLIRQHLFYCADETRENMDDFTFCETVAHKATITTSFPKEGDYCLEIYGTDFPPSQEDLPLLATFFIRCLKPLETGCKTFPQIIGRLWGPGCCLYEPLVGVLSRDKEVTFRVNIPDADDVVLKSPDSVTNMFKDQSGMWTCSYTPVQTDTSLLILGKFDKTVNRYVGLLEFKVDD